VPSRTTSCILISIGLISSSAICVCNKLCWQIWLILNDRKAMDLHTGKWISSTNNPAYYDCSAPSVHSQSWKVLANFIVYICLSTGISAAATGHLSYWGLNENLSRNSTFHHNQTKVLDAMPEDQNVFQVVGSYIYSTTVERMHCCVTMTACSIYYIFAAKCRSAIQWEHTVAFPWQQWVHECARMYLVFLVSFPSQTSCDISLLIKSCFVIRSVALRTDSLIIICLLDICIYIGSCLCFLWI